MWFLLLLFWSPRLYLQQTPYCLSHLTTAFPLPFPFPYHGSWVGSAADCLYACTLDSSVSLFLGITLQHAWFLPPTHPTGSLPVWQPVPVCMSPHSLGSFYLGSVTLGMAAACSNRFCSSPSFPGFPAPTSLCHYYLPTIPPCHHVSPCYHLYVNMAA